MTPPIPAQSPARSAVRATAPPPFSPVLLAGLALRILPLAPLQPALALALRAVLGRHPGLLDRLAGLGEPVFIVDPVDLPFVFVLCTGARPSLRAARAAAAPEARAVVRGALMDLIDLLQGRDDGDALFFSRRLIVEGDTGAVLALRTALDGAEVDLAAEVLAALGPLAAPARDAGSAAAALWARARDDLETVRSAMLAPLSRQVAAQGRTIARLEEALRASGTDRRRALRSVRP
jgi:O2-independent ubiquinone biosynthesis accessory factor UbiT